MSYLALYRRFRPDSFDKVIGQEAIVTTLQNQIKSGSVGHAYLFCGARGTGKTTLAKIFAKAVNCVSPVNGSPCGECEACKNLQNPANLNVIEMDAASNNKVENVRTIRENVQFPPVGVKYKVYIIDEVHMLTTEAFNALLKTLEEPPKHAVFILATTEPHKLPQTILSRCMRFDFKLVSVERIASLISNIYDEIGKKYTSEAVTAIAKAGEGSVRDALSVADLCVSVGDGKLTYNDVLSVLGATDSKKTGALMRAILTGDTGSVLYLTNELSSLGKSIGLICKDLVSYARDLTVIKTVKNANEVLSLPLDAFNDMKEIASLTDEHGLLRALEIFSKIDNDLRYSSAPRAVLETALIKASMPSIDYDLDAILSRVKKLETAFDEIKNSGSVTVKTANSNSVSSSEVTALKTEVLSLKEEIESLKRELNNAVNANIAAKPVETVRVVEYEETPAIESKPTVFVKPVNEAVKPQVSTVEVKPKKVETVNTENDYYDSFIPPEDDNGGAFMGINDEFITSEPTEEVNPVEVIKPTVEVKPVSEAVKPQVTPEVKPVTKPQTTLSVDTANVNAKRVWGSVIRKLRANTKKTILWVACQEMSADIENGVFYINAGGDDEKNVIMRPDNFEVLEGLIHEFCSLEVRVRGSQGEEESDDKILEKVTNFFGEENLTIKN